MVNLIGRISIALCISAIGVASAASGALAINNAPRVEDVVDFYGLIVTRYYPGPPNYDSTSRREKIKVILIDDSIIGNKDRSIQLYFPPEKRALAACVVSGCKARVSGRLFEAESGHHHTAQILEVTNFELDVACREKMHAAGTRTTLGFQPEVQHLPNQTHFLDWRLVT